MKKTYVLDCSIFLHDPEALLAFQDNEVLVPLAVIDELDRIRNKGEKKAVVARKALAIIEDCRKSGNLAKGARLGNGGLLRIDSGEDLPTNLTSIQDMVVMTALNASKRNKKPVILLSRDVASIIKAESFGVSARKYVKDEEGTSEDDLYDEDAVSFIDGYPGTDGPPEKEDEEFELDPQKPLVLLLGNVDHEGIRSSLSASKRQYKKKLLESTPKNWASIIEIFEKYTVSTVLVKLAPQTFRLLADSNYTSVRDQLFAHIALIPNAVFVYEDLFTGKKQEDWEDRERAYPSRGSLDLVLNWLERSGVDLILYKKNAEVTVLAEAFLFDTEKNLIFRLYIPTSRIWSNETDRFLQLFRDYLERVEHLTVRLDQRRTNQGTIYEFHGDEPQRDTLMQNEFKSFSQLMELCASDTKAAEALLEKRQINHKEIIEIVSRFSKEAKRLQVDLKHERERKILSVRQLLESELIDLAPSKEDWDTINMLVNAAIPLLVEPSSFGHIQPLSLLPIEASSAISCITINIRPQIIESVNGVVGQEIYGNQYLTQEDRQLLALIKEHGSTKAGELESAVHELADNSVPQPDRLGAKQKIKKFLIEVGKRTTDVAVGVLQTYIENKLGL